MKTLVFALVSGTALRHHAFANHALQDVVKKLEGMLTTSKTNGEEDTKGCALMTCKKNTLIEEAKATIEECANLIATHSGEVEQLRGENGKLSQEIASLDQQEYDNEQQQSEAEATRTQEKEAFDAQKLDLEGAVGQLGDAIKILADIGADQTAEEGRDTADRDRFIKTQLAQVAVQSAAKALPADKRGRVSAFLQSPHSGTYSNQSGEIIGILKNQKDTFEHDLDAAQKLETKRAESHVEMMEIYANDLESIRESRTEKEGQLSTNSSEIETKTTTIDQKKTEKTTAEESLEFETGDLSDKTKRCEQRRSTRAKEEAALAKAVAVLNSDTAFTNKSFDGTLAETSFLQLEAHNPFSTVLVEITKMIKSIDDEEEADTEKKTWCEKEIADYDTNLSETTTEKDRQNANVVTHQSDLATYRDDLEKAQNTIKQLQEERKETLETRREGNKVYQAMISELQEAHDILAKAVTFLKEFYESDEATAAAAAAADETEAHQHAPQQDEGEGVLTLLATIQSDTEATEKQTHKDEEASQGSFETEMKVTDESIAQGQLDAQNAREAIAKAEEDLLAADTEVARLKEVEKSLNDYKKSIDPGCQFIEDHFDKRQAARTEEKKQLQAAETAVKEREAAHNYKA